jgi:hypothetical protein
MCCSDNDVALVLAHQRPQPLEIEMMAAYRLLSLASSFS